MTLVYPAHFQIDCTGEIIVSFRDLPECLTSGADEAEALAEAQDALGEAIAGRIDDGEEIPTPSPPHAGEHAVPVPFEMKTSLEYHMTRQNATFDTAFR